MEEDIKDLKKYISFANKSENFPHDTDWKWHKEVATKIQNLIARNEELEKENEELLEVKVSVKSHNIIEELIKENKELNGKIKSLKLKDNVIYRQQYFDLLRNSIPISKIQDKIEDLKRYIYTGENAPQDFLQYRVKAKIQVLQELLEE